MNKLKEEIKLLINGDLINNVEGYKQFLNNNGTNKGFKSFEISNRESYKDF
jgi:hypothetical protein